MKCARLFLILAAVTLAWSSSRSVAEESLLPAEWTTPTTRVCGPRCLAFAQLRATGKTDHDRVLSLFTMPGDAEVTLDDIRAAAKTLGLHVHTYRGDPVLLGLSTLPVIVQTGSKFADKPAAFAVIIGSQASNDRIFFYQPPGRKGERHPRDVLANMWGNEALIVSGSPIANVDALLQPAGSGWPISYLVMAVCLLSFLIAIAIWWWRR